MRQAASASASASASRGKPWSVRSPQRTRTSARSHTSVNAWRSGSDTASRMCRSPSAAMRIFATNPPPCPPGDVGPGVGIPPRRHIGDVIMGGEQRPPADGGLRGAAAVDLALRVLEAYEQLMEDPRGDGVPFGRVGKPEIDEMREQDLPFRPHAVEQPLT